MDNITVAILKDALKLLRSGKSKEAGAILSRLLKDDPSIEQAWHMLAFTTDDRAKQARILRKVLRLNPDNENAKKQLEQVLGGTPLTAPYKKRGTGE